MSDNLLKIGKIGKAYGLKGCLTAIFFDPSQKILDSLLLKEVYVGRDSSSTQKIQIIQWKRQYKKVILTIEGVHSIDLAQVYHLMNLYLPYEQLAPLKEDELYISDMFDYSVIYQNNQNFLIEDIFESNDCLFIKLNDPNQKTVSSFLIPYNQHFFGHIDKKNKTIELKILLA